jgi:SAM-dependent methyltransferase
MIARLRGTFRKRQRNLKKSEVCPTCKDIEYGFEITNDYDVVLFIAVLQHLTNWRYALNKLIRRVRVGGYLVVDEWFPNSPFARIDIATKDPAFGRFYALREKHTGIFWDPEVRAHDVLAVRHYLKGAGFVETVWDEFQPAVSPRLPGVIDLRDNIIAGKGFGPLAWGHGPAYDSFIHEQKDNLPQLQVAKTMIGFKVYDFRKSQDHSYYHSVSTPVFETRIASHFGVQLPPAPSSRLDPEILRHVQALQIGLHYSCFVPHTRFAFPIIANHDLDTGELHLTGTRPTRAVLVPGHDNQSVALDSITRLVTNVLVLPQLAANEWYGSVTAGLLKLFEKDPKLSHFSFRLVIKDGPPTAVAKQIEGVDLLECSLPPCSQSRAYERLRESVREHLETGLLRDSYRYTFGEWNILDFERIRKSLAAIPEIGALALRSGTDFSENYVKALAQHLKALPESKAVLELFQLLIPMMEANEQLLLIFSPVRTELKEGTESQAVRAESLGAFAVLEGVPDEPESMLAFRVARLEFLNLTLQWALLSELYGVLGPEARYLSLLRKRRKRLLDNLKQIDSDVFYSERRFSEVLDFCRTALSWGVAVEGKDDGPRTIHHMFVNQGPESEAALKADQFATCLSEHIIATIRALLPDPDDADHIDRLFALLRPCVKGGSRWWPLLAKGEGPVKDFWPAYFQEIVQTNIALRELKTSGALLIPFLAYPLASLHNTGRNDRPKPRTSELHLIADETTATVLITWDLPMDAPSQSLSSILEKPSYSADRLTGRLRFLERLFGRLSGRGFYHLNGKQNFCFSVHYGKT